MQKLADPFFLNIQKNLWHYLSHTYKRTDGFLTGTTCLPCFGWKVHLAVSPQSGSKQKIYCTVYYITINSNCEAERVSKNLKKIEDRVKRQN